MKFAIITHAVHKLKDKNIYAYEPYVREMNLWLKYVDEVAIIAPVSYDEISAIDSEYHLNKEMLKQVQHDVTIRHSVRNTESYELEVGAGIQLIKIPSFDITSIKNLIQAILKIPIILFRIYKAMQWAEHIHLRCPGNIGLLGCIIQIFFPNKSKTVKYAGNWDPKSKQPLSYRFQKWIVSNTFLTKNAKVLVYGEWPNQSKNIVPFFTASYSEEEFDEKIQIARSQTSYNDKKNRHPEFISGSFEKEQNKKMLNRVPHDAIQSQSEKDSIEQNRSDETDNTEEQIARSQTSHNDKKNRHPEFISGSFEKEQNKKMLNRVKHDAIKSHLENDNIEQSRSVKSGDDNCIYFLFVGALTKGKQPLLSVKVVHELKKKGYHVLLNMYGEGIERNHIEQYIQQHQLNKTVILHGNAPKDIVKKAYQKAQFLLFISKSEGWPKVVAEAMFWDCLPISSNVSCIPYMLGNGSRGAIVNTEIKEIVSVIENYLKNNKKYSKQVKEAMQWSRQFTLEQFEKEIGKLLE